jgi:hypothetical protein
LVISFMVWRCLDGLLWGCNNQGEDWGEVP